MTLPEIEAMTPRQAVQALVYLAQQTSEKTEEGKAMRIVLREYRQMKEELSLVREKAVNMNGKLQEALCLTNSLSGSK